MSKPETTDLSPIEKQAIALASMVVNCNASMKKRIYVLDVCTEALKAAYDSGRKDGEAYASP